MKKESVNLDKLKEEIKQRKSPIITDTGERQSNGSFLLKLKESLYTGRTNVATEAIKEVENKAIDIHNRKKGSNEKPVFNVNKSVLETTSRGGVDINDDIAREEALFKSFNKPRERSIDEEIERLYGVKQKTNQQIPNQGMGINEGALIGVVDKYITENYVRIVEESIRRVMLETYADERIKETIIENRNFMKSIVVDIIKELQKNKKPQ
jgi:hypothetical protein